MFQTNQVTQSLNGQSGIIEILEFLGAVQCGGVEDYVVVYMGSVGVGCHNERMLSFGKAFCQFIPNLICFFGSNLSRLEWLANLVGDNLVLLVFSCDVLILPLGKQKFFIHRHRVALITGNQVTFGSFLRVLCIVCPLPQALCHGLSFVDMQRNQPRSCHMIPPMVL